MGGVWPQVSTYSSDSLETSDRFYHAKTHTTTREESEVAAKAKLQEKLPTKAKDPVGRWRKGLKEKRGKGDSTAHKGGQRLQQLWVSRLGETRRGAGRLLTSHLCSLVPRAMNGSGVWDLSPRTILSPVLSNPGTSCVCIASAFDFNPPFLH